MYRYGKIATQIIHHKVGLFFQVFTLDCLSNNFSSCSKYFEQRSLIPFKPLNISLKGKIVHLGPEIVTSKMVTSSTDTFRV